MIDYNEASKMVKPKLEALRLAEARLQDAVSYLITIATYAMLNKNYCRSATYSRQK